MLTGLCLALLFPIWLSAAETDPLKRASALSAEALQLLRQGRLAEGVPKAREALALREQALGPNHPLVAESLMRLAELLRFAGDYPAARPLYERALMIREQAFGPTDPSVASTLAGLAELLRFAGEYAAARPLHERALQIREQALGPTDPAVADSLNGLADLLRDSGDFAAARPLYERALMIQEGALAPTHRAIASTLTGLADLLRYTGDYAAAKPLYERALKIREQALGPNHPSVASTLNGLGDLHRYTHNYAAARPLYERALKIREQALGPNHPAVASTLNDLAELLRGTGNYAAARPLFERALKIREQALGPNHPSVATTLNALGYLLHRTRDYAGARPLYERALRIREQTLGPNHPWVAASLNTLAFLLWTTRDYAGARPLYERAIRIREQTLGPNHPSVGWSLNGLAYLLWTSGDSAGARPLFERGLTIARSAGVPDLQWRAALGLGRTHERAGRPAEALPLYQEAVKALEGLAGQFEDEAQRAQFLQAENRLAPYDALSSLLLKLHEQDGNKGYDGQAWAVIEAKKGRVTAEALGAARPKLQNTQAQAEAQKAQAKQDQAQGLEEALRQEQAKPLKDQQAEKVQNLTALLAKTKAEYLTQVQAFLTRYPQYKSQFVDQQTVDPKALAKFADRLPPGTLAVQYFAAPDTLYLFVVAPGGRFQVKSQAVSQADLYGMIKEYRQYLERAGQQRLLWADGGSEAYRRDVAPLKDLTRKLAAHLLGPIQADLEAHRNLILIPNDLLLYLPIHALTRAQPDGADRFLAETHAVSYVTQLELVDLLTPGKPAANAPLLALANPDGTLPAASQEIRALRRIRPSVTALEGADATKTRFLSQVGQFADLHLATHGVLDPQRPERSYLLMAGQDEASQRLGIGEIAGLSLPPNGLAILSACETALGEQVPGAALSTLAAAFSQAGAQSVMASLWKVNDASTRDFMVAFHRALPTGGRASALQQAQMTVLKDPQTAHPYYWAPFILIGAR